MTSSDSEPDLGWIDEPEQGRFRYSYIFINQYEDDPTGARTQGTYVINSTYSNTEYATTDCKIELYVSGDDVEITPSDENKTVYRITKDTEILEMSTIKSPSTVDMPIYKISNEPYFSKDEIPVVTFHASNEGVIIDESAFTDDDGNLVACEFVYPDGESPAENSNAEPCGLILEPLIVLWDDCSLFGSTLSSGVWTIYSLEEIFKEFPVATLELEVAKEINSFTITPETPVIEIINSGSVTLYKINNGYFSSDTLLNSKFEVTLIGDDGRESGELSGDEIFTGESFLQVVPYALEYGDAKVLEPGIYTRVLPSSMKDEGISSMTISVIK